MIFQIYHPAPHLSEIVEYYWYSKIETTESAIQNYPTPLLQGLAFNFYKKEEQHAYNGKVVKLYKQAYFFGQPTCPRVITPNKTGVDIICVKFKPLGIARVTGINMSHMADSIVAAEDIWGNEIESLCDKMQSEINIESGVRILESYLFSKYLKVKQDYCFQNVSNALCLIDFSQGNYQIKDLQDKTNTTRKTLERNFVQAIGLKPKIYTEIVQFNAVKSRLDDISQKQKVSDVALDYGYYNSSHLASQFKRFSGLTPKQYLKSLIVS